MRYRFWISGVSFGLCECSNCHNDLRCQLNGRSHLYHLSYGHGIWKLHGCSGGLYIHHFDHLYQHNALPDWS